MKSFLTGTTPFTTMLQVATPEDAFTAIERAKALGTSAFGFQIERLKREYRTQEVYRDLFETRMGSSPVYLTSYRAAQNQGMSDEECVEELEFALSCGGTLGDIMGDCFAKERGQVRDELTLEPQAIDRQRYWIDRLHGQGKEVLMSSHVYRFIPAERVLEIAFAHQSRGADISKIVTAANTPEEEAECLRILTLLKKELKIPFLFLCGGEHCKFLRTAGTYFGNCTNLCVESYTELATKVQPSLELAKRICDTLESVYKEKK